MLRQNLADRFACRVEQWIKPQPAVENVGNERRLKIEIVANLSTPTPTTQLGGQPAQTHAIVGKRLKTSRRQSCWIEARLRKSHRKVPTTGDPDGNQKADEYP
jgi:hypothetical protein